MCVEVIRMNYLKSKFPLLVSAFVISLPLGACSFPNEPTYAVKNETSEVLSTEVIERFLPEKAEHLGYEVTYTINDEEMSRDKATLNITIKEILEGYIYKIRKEKNKISKESYNPRKQKELIARNMLVSGIFLPLCFADNTCRDNLSGNPKLVETEKTIETIVGKKETLERLILPLRTLENFSLTHNNLVIDVSVYGPMETKLNIDYLIKKINPSDASDLKLTVSATQTKEEIGTVIVPEEIVSTSIKRIEADQKKLDEYKKQKELERKIEKIKLEKLATERQRKLTLERSNLSDIDKIKRQCTDLGFKRSTEKFGECVLKLSE